MTEKHALRDDAIAIWRAGVEAVDSARLVRNVVRRNGDRLEIHGHDVPLSMVRRIAVVGAGKAGGGMAAGFEQAVGDRVLEDKVIGWINVPADCLRPLKKIHLHPARPAGVNEPTQQGVEGALRILEIVSQLEADDVCVVLLSGGGSALLPAPVAEITLDDKQQVTRLLMYAGANISELNCVRKQLSRIKGGGLDRATNAGLLITLIVSDVIGDPLDVIASGPTVADSSTPSDALAILKKYADTPQDVPQRVWDYLSAAALAAGDPLQRVRQSPERGRSKSVHNYIIGNNATALGAAAERAGQLGYRVHSLGSNNAGEAKVVGCELAELALAVRDQQRPVAPPACLLSGGEPVVHLAKTDQPRTGGRNQELVLAGLGRLFEEGMRDIVLLSGGTDGEDGPTDAAGALADEWVLQIARDQGLIVNEFLSINNSYPFFERTGGLLKTGPTQTNVMDLRVVLVGALHNR